MKQVKRWKQDMSTKMKEEEVTETDRKEEEVMEMGGDYGGSD